MKKTPTKHTTSTTSKPRARAADPGAGALHRIVAILRPLTAERRAQVLRAVTSYYGSGESGGSGT